eukprot:9230917-Alexandrium_andersonii.AAC.1
MRGSPRGTSGLGPARWRARDERAVQGADIAARLFKLITSIKKDMSVNDYFRLLTLPADASRWSLAGR